MYFPSDSGSVRGVTSRNKTCHDQKLSPRSTLGPGRGCLRSHELNSGLTDKTRKWLVDLIDESLQAGLELQSSGKEGAPVGPASQTMSGAHVAAVSQTGTLASHAEKSGISAVPNTGTRKVSSSKRKHPRKEEATFEQGPHSKMQRTSGAFGEACLASVTTGAGTVLENPKQEVGHA